MSTPEECKIYCGTPLNEDPQPLSQKPILKSKKESL